MSVPVGAKNWTRPVLVFDGKDVQVDEAFLTVGDEVRELGSKRLSGGRLSRGAPDLFHQGRRRAPPRTFPERSSGDVLFREAAGLHRESIAFDEGAVQIHDAGEERALVEERPKARVRDCRFRVQGAFAPLGATPLGDVAEHQDAADDFARLVPDRSGTVVDGVLDSVFADEHRVIGEADDRAVSERSWQRVARPVRASLR